MSVQGPVVPTDGEPRGCFAVFAGVEGKAQGGYRDYQGSFHSAHAAKEYGTYLFTERSEPFEWVQVADVFHGAVWELQGQEWIVIRGDDPL